MHVIHKPKGIRAHLGRKIAISLLFFFIIALTAGLWYWNTHKKRIIRNELEKAITKKSNGLYQVKYDDLQIDEIAGNLTITNMHVVYDSTKYDSLVKINAVPSTLLDLYIPTISVSGVKTPRALVDKEIVANKLQIINPSFSIFYTGGGKDSSRYTPGKEIYEQILGNLNLIKIDTAEIKNATIISTSFKKEKDTTLFKNVNITLSDVSVDSASNADTSRLLFSKGIIFNCENIAWRSKNQLYNYSLDQLAFNSDSKDITIQHVTIKPQAGEDAFVKSLPFQSDRFDISLSDISLKNINTQGVMNETLLADELEIKSSTIKVYRDLGITRDQISRIGTYPQQQLVKIPLPFVIPKTNLSNVFISYRERNDITKKVGEVKFNNCSINIDNLANKPSALEKNSICRIDINTDLLNLTPMKAVLTLRLGDKDGRFNVEGSAGHIDALKLNQLAEPMGLARIKKGDVKSLHFNLAGNNYRTDGTVKLLYDDLYIEFLELNDDNKTFNKKHFTSFVSNLILKNANPGKNGEIRIGEVHHERDMNRSFYNLIWKSIFEGVNKTIGNKRKMKRP